MLSDFYVFYFEVFGVPFRDCVSGVLQWSGKHQMHSQIYLKLNQINELDFMWIELTNGWMECELKNQRFPHAKYS